MKGQVFSILSVIVGLGIAGLAFSGCDQAPSTSQLRGDVKVQIPRQTEPGVYKFSIVTLRDIENLYEFRGKYGRFILTPSVEGNQLLGPTPKTMFLRNKDGVYIPEDVVTQQIAFIYSVLQDMYELDRQLGLEKINTWPRVMGISVNLVDDMNRIVDNNAIYQEFTDATLFPPSRGSNPQIYLNEGVLAHEYFHSLFYKLVLAGLSKKERKEILPSIESENNTTNQSDSMSLAEQEINQEVAQTINDVYLRALNEGIADYWGWLYTRDSNFIAVSIPEERERRSLDRIKADFTNGFLRKDNQFIDTLLVEQTVRAFVLRKIKRLNLSMTSVIKNEEIIDLSYNIGNILAKNLKEMATNIESSDGPLIIARAITEALPELKNDYLSLKPHESYNPIQFLAKVVQKKDVGMKNCQFVKMIANERFRIVECSPKVDPK